MQAAPGTQAAGMQVADAVRTLGYGVVRGALPPSEVAALSANVAAELLRPSALRNAWKPCALQLNKRSLLVLKLSHGKASNDDALSANDNTQRVVKTYHALDLRAVRYCTRCAKTRNAFEVCTADGGKVRRRTSTPLTSAGLR